ncbi:MAG: 23S rRNA (guanosine(2251)-2'-O)-methyltransferase RlmB [Flavobacteriales bacterium]|nr:23S rRNA (guanosine(2251)-2'-O)-methyltransferase RlmB [Flavobacteriales bacterium]
MENQTIFGIRAILEAIENEITLDKVFLLKESQGTLMRQLLHQLKQKGVNFQFVPEEKFYKFKDKNHQGAMAQIAPVNFWDLEMLVEKVMAEESKPLFLLLDQISDARNFGAILRTAACCGVHGIIVPKSGSAPVNADTIKTSAGGIFHVPICKVDHLKDALFYLQGSEVAIFAATEKAENNIYQANFNQPMALIMGSEDRGINPTLLKVIEHKVKLPMTGKIASLNVSVASGAILYEVIRQRQE